MQLKKKMVVVLSTALVMSAFAGCSAQSTNTDSSLTEGGVIATYTQGSLDQKDFSDQLISKSGMLVLLDMVDKGILDVVEPVTDEITANVESNLANIKTYYTEGFEESLKINGFKDEADLKNSLILNEQKNAYTLKYIISNNVTDEEIQTYYDEFTPSIEASHILIMPKDESEASITEAKDTATKLIARINAGEDFAALAKEFSDDTGSGAQGGALGAFTKGAMVPEFEEAAYALKLNEVTAEPIKTEFGFHIIKKTLDDTKKSFEDMKPEIQITLASQKLEADQNLTFKALVKLREDNGFSISNPVISEQYKIFAEQVNK